MNRNKTWLIFKHEFAVTIKRVSFIVMTLAIPVVALLGIGLYQLITTRATPAPQAATVGYVDQAGGFDQYTSQGVYTLRRFGTPDEAREALVSASIEEYVVIPPDYLSTGLVYRFTLKREIDTPSDTQRALESFLVANMLGGKVSPAVIDRAEAPLNLVTTTLTGNGAVAPQQGGLATFIVSGAFGLFFALALIFSSNYFVQGLGEEKENRLMEMLLSSVSARGLLAGKLLGLGLAGLVQVSVWVVSAPLILNLASSTLAGFISTIHLPVSFLILCVVYFVLGYAVFAVLAAAAGAIGPTAKDAQQISSLFFIFALVPLWGMGLVVAAPNNPAWVALSIFPFSAPVLMIERLGLVNVPAWQIMGSLVVLVVTAVGGLFLAAGLFKSDLLMRGKMPALREIVRALGR